MSRALRIVRAAVWVLAAFSFAPIPASANVPPLVLPAPVSRTLPNGLRVVVFPKHDLPIVQVQLQLAAGSAYDPPDKGGVASLTSQLVRQGTSSRSAAEFTQAVDDLGATIASTVTRDAAQLGAGCRADLLDPTLELLSDATLNPIFDDDAFEAARRQFAMQMGQRSRDLGQLADDQFAAAVFGAHAYAHPVSGTIQSLVKVQRDDVRAFHRDRWRPDGAILAIAGDVDPDSVFASADRWFGRWSGHVAAPPAPAAIAAPPGLRLLDAPSRFAEIRMGTAAPGRGDPGFASWRVAEQALRSQMLPGQALVTFTPGKEASLFELSATVVADSAAATVERLQHALRSFAAAPPSGAALAPVQRGVARSFARSVETLGELLSSWLAGTTAGLPDDHLATAALAMVSPAAAGDAASAARRLAQPLVVLVAGPASRVRPALAALGPVSLVSLEGPAASAAPARPITAADRQRGRELIASAVLAHGGAIALRAAHSSYYDGELEMVASGQSIPGQCRFLRIDPARMAYALRFLSFENHQILDGDRGWTLVISDTTSMTSADSTAMRALRATFDSDIVHLLRAASAPQARPVFRGRLTRAGKPYDLVEFTSPEQLSQRLLLDATTHRIGGVDGVPEGGLWRDQRTLLSYVKVEGLWLPTIEERRVDDQLVSVFRVRNLTVNAPADTNIFRKPVIRHGQIVGVEH